MAEKPDSQLLAAIGMMGSSTTLGDAEAVNAFRLATRMLEKRGLKWRDVAERAFGDGPATHRPTSEPRDAAGTRRWSSPPPPDPPPSPPPASPPPPEARERASARPSVRKEGFAVPTTVTGVVRLSPGSRRDKETIVFDVDGDDATYGPMMAFAGAVTDRIYAADGKRVLMRVRPPRRNGEMPQAVSCGNP